MVARRIARCACGDLQLACEGEPRKVSMCHCLDCQWRTGSVLSIAAFYDRSAVALLRGRPRRFTRESASGQPVTFQFCGNCGANVFWEPARIPLLVGVAVGAFGEPDFPAPQQVVWTRDRPPWLGLPEGLPSFEANPPPKPTSPPA